VSIEDKIKWDKKYQNNIELLAKREPSKMLVKFAKECKGDMALDLACGSGRNTLFLEEQGFFVDAVDISKIALDTLKSRVKSSRVNIIEADLDEFEIKKDKYDLIVKCNFLDRDLIKRAKEALKKDGIIIIETYIEDKDNEKKDSNPNFLLKKDELPEMFKSNFEILEYKTFWNESFEKYRMKKAAIAARKI